MQSISEDNTMMYNKWVQGIASRDLKGNQMFVTDLLQQQDNQNYTNSDVGAPNIRIPAKLPYPLDTIYDDLAGFTIAYSNIVDKLQRASVSPILSRADKQKYDTVINSFKRIEGIMNETFQVFEKNIEPTEEKPQKSIDTPRM